MKGPAWQEDLITVARTLHGPFFYYYSFDLRNYGDPIQLLNKENVGNDSFSTFLHKIDTGLREVPGLFNK